MQSTESPRYLYVGRRLDVVAVFATDALTATTERHRVLLDVGALAATTDVIRELDRHPGIAGVVIALTGGLVDRARLRIARVALGRGLRVWLHWPNEHAVEYVDLERLQSLHRHRVAAIALERLGRPAHRLLEASKRFKPGLRWIYRGMFPVRRYDLLAQLDRWSLDARPVPFRTGSSAAEPRRSKFDAGLYLRTDFWVRITSGGSYGHTCYVAKELAARHRAGSRACCRSATSCSTRSAYAQAVMDPPPNVTNEDAIVSGVRSLLSRSSRRRAGCCGPSYIYERLCLGNWVAALLSRELQIPYIVEYNGSEMSMQRSFNNTAPVYEDVYLKGEEVAFRQATAISVISTHVKADLVSRGVDARQDSRESERRRSRRLRARRRRTRSARIRRALGFGDDDCVVGFTGTFGWWHGIDVLAAAIPRICAAVPSVKFLLIGDGTHKPQLDAEVERHGLDERVRRVGRVPQERGRASC